GPYERAAFSSHYPQFNGSSFWRWLLDLDRELLSYSVPKECSENNIFIVQCPDPEQGAKSVDDERIY
ncbi:11673_t:CDS:2, partial [Acaulospora morrowiae]